MQRKVMSILGTLFLGTIYLLTLCTILLAASNVGEAGLLSALSSIQ